MHTPSMCVVQQMKTKTSSEYENGMLKLLILAWTTPIHNLPNGNKFAFHKKHQQIKKIFELINPFKRYVYLMKWMDRIFRK